MQLFYAPDITPPLYTLSEEESKHCVRVLRLGRGDTLHITDGRGNLFCCQITDDNPKRCTVRVTTTQAQWEPLPYRLVMAVAPTKNADRFEWFLEKATEVGVSAIVPLETEHSERLPPGAAPAYAVPRGRSQAVRGAEIHRPLCPGAVARRQNLPARDASQRRVGAGLHRPRRRFLGRRDRFRACQRIRGDHPRHAAPAHRNRSRRRHGHGVCGQRRTIKRPGGEHSRPRNPVPATGPPHTPD